MSGPGELARDVTWQRLDPRMMLVHPLRELVRFLPVLVGVFVAGSTTDGDGRGWQLLGVAAPVALGLLRYLTTGFRVAAGRVELRRGLLSRHVLSTPVDRVRTVDLTATPVQRALGLVTVRIGTGTASTDDDDALDLDGLPAARARRLREELLRAAPVRDSGEGVDGADGLGPAAGVALGVPAAARPAPARLVLRLDPAWARFAPLTSAGVVLAAGLVGVASQLLQAVGRSHPLRPGRLVDGALGLGWWIGVPLVVLALAAVVSVLAVAGYVVANFGLTLTRTPGSWHLVRGLLTTRETSLDEERIGGVVVAEPLGLRLAGGARLQAIVTGLGRQQASSVLVPPAPVAVVRGVAGEVLGRPAPVVVPLTGHGPRARTRRWTRALVPAVVVAVTLLLLVVLADAPPWLLAPALLVVPVAAALAADRVRGLGHALVDDHLVASSGSLDRRREVLATGSVIGWTQRATWFQRRAGLCSLVATTAGGRQRVTVLDLPEPDAVALAAAATPGLLDPFTILTR